MNKILIGFALVAYSYLVFMTGVFANKIYVNRVVEKTYSYLYDNCYSANRKFVIYNKVKYKNIDCAVLSEVQDMYELFKII